MTFDTLPSVITLLIALSVATERFVEIIKNLWPWLDAHQEDPRAEGRRRAALQGLAVVGGVAITVLAGPVVGEVMPGETRWLTLVGLGLLASGGSGFWNSMLTYVVSLKELKRVEVRDRTAPPAEVQVTPQPLEGELRA